MKLLKIKHQFNIFHQNKYRCSQITQLSESARLNCVKISENKQQNELKRSKKKQILFIHGLYGNYKQFIGISKQQEIIQIADSYLIDLRNHGYSQHKERMSIKEMAQDIKEMIFDKGLDELFIVGHSLGGKIAMGLISEFYEDIGDRIKGIVVGDMGCFNYLEEQRSMGFITEQYWMNQQLRNINVISQPKHKIYQQVLQATNYNVKSAESIISNLSSHEYIHDSFQWNINFQAIHDYYQHFCSYIPYCSNYSKPFLVLLGEQSPFVPVTHYHHYNNFYKSFDPNKHIKYITKASHWIHLQNQQEFINQLSLFITQNQ